jgi:hypothetical protein
MKIDLNLLRADVKTRTLSRAASPIGRVKTGATEVIRENLAELLQMRADGASWPELAAGLAAQGVIQGDNEPLTGRRLTALINNIKVRSAKLALKANRATSVSTSKNDSSATRVKKTPSKGGQVMLAPEMRESASPLPPSSDVDEQELRLAELARHAHLLTRR